MSWLSISADSPFSIANIPFGIISTASDSTRRPAVAIGNYVLDLKAFSAAGGFANSADISKEQAVFAQSTLNDFAALGRPFHRLTREYLQSIFKSKTKPDSVTLLPLPEVQMHVPLAIGDYTDFYASTNHAYHVGVMFRGAANALQPNYKRLPVGYHGRSSSVVVSGTPLRRPWGQILRDPKSEVKVPEFAKCEKLDIELEMGMFVCRPNALGSPVPVGEAEQHIFGYVLLNDWSARDIQAWEYVPLGPFTAKNFGTSISPWVVLADAAIPKVSGLPNDTQLLPYLEEGTDKNVLDITLEVDLITSSGAKKTITKTNSKNLLWSWSQMIAHHTITGCNLQTGDLLGSGTISGDQPGTEGSLLEQTLNGKIPVTLDGGEQRKFLEDGDTVVIRGWAGPDGARIGFGEVSGTIQAPLPLFQ